MRSVLGPCAEAGLLFPDLAFYARVSTDEQYPEAQLAELRAYAARRGAEGLEYVDHGVTGTRGRRPALDAMLAAVRRREFSAVVVVRLDRLARSLAHMAALGEELQALDVEMVSVTEGIDTSTPTGRALFGMCGVFAQLEADLIRERTKAGLAAARRRGRPDARRGRSVARIRSN
jgi:DNA invertase Pin-like site-specific DNA recombinase